MNMKKIRDQARKENKAMKTNVKGMTKAVKKIPANASDSMAATTNDLSRKVADAKDSVLRSAQTIKANAKGNFKKSGQIKREFSTEQGKGATNGKHIGHDAARKVKHY